MRIHIFIENPTKYRNYNENSEISSDLCISIVVSKYVNMKVNSLMRGSYCVNLNFLYFWVAHENDIFELFCLIYMALSVIKHGSTSPST